MICPECEKRMKCIDSRNYGDATYRRYECPECSHRVTSAEKIISSKFGLKTVKHLVEEQRNKKGRKNDHPKI